MAELGELRDPLSGQKIISRRALVVALTVVKFCTKRGNNRLIYDLILGIPSTGSTIFTDRWMVQLVYFPMAIITMIIRTIMPYMVTLPSHG